MDTPVRITGGAGGGRAADGDRVRVSGDDRETCGAPPADDDRKIGGVPPADGDRVSGDRVTRGPRSADPPSSRTDRRRGPVTGRLRVVCAVLAVCWVAGTARLTLWPEPFDPAQAGAILRALATLHSWGLPSWIDYGVVEFSANIALFVPAGLLGVALFGARRGGWVILVGFAMSAGIETAQLLFLPTRVPSLADVLANTSGTLVGVALGLVLLPILPGRGGGSRAGSPFPRP